MKLTIWLQGSKANFCHSRHVNFFPGNQVGFPVSGISGRQAMPVLTAWRTETELNVSAPSPARIQGPPSPPP